MGTLRLFFSFLSSTLFVVVVAPNHYHKHEMRDEVEKTVPFAQHISLRIPQQPVHSPVSVLLTAPVSCLHLLSSLLPQKLCMLEVRVTSRNVYVKALYKMLSILALPCPLCTSQLFLCHLVLFI